MSPRKYFVTDDTALATYLYLCGMEFVKATLVNRNNPRRKKFIIFDTPERPQMEDEFYKRTTKVTPLDYHEARVEISRLLKKTVPDPRPPEEQMLQ